MARPGYTILVHKDGALSSRQWQLPFWVARALVTVAAALGVALLLLAVLYGPTVTAAARVPLLERENARLRAENARVSELALRLDEAEARYAHLRAMLGAGVPIPEVPPDSAAAGAEDGYVAPPMLARAPTAAPLAESEGPSVPHRWPLAVPSYRTRGLAEGDPSVESHSGLDLAVPVGSDVRAAGGGLVRRTGIDTAYGQFILLEHPKGYESMYGHLSRVLVTQNAAIRSGQVIGLSGNSGRSSAPHLHFEIRRDGRSVDPLTLVREGR